MSAALAQFHFLRPWWLCALAVLPWLLWQAARRGRGLQALARLVDAELLPALLQGQAVRQRLPLGLLALAWTLAVLALAGPTWSRVEQPLYARRAAQVVAISLSQRMLSHDVAPSRLDRARYKAHDLLLANRDGLNGLLGYAGEAFVVAPLTSDVHSLGALLDAMAPDTMPVDGDNAAAAIRRGAALIRDAKAGGGSLVLITDTADAAAQDAARKALAEGVRVSVLGVGTPQGAPVPLPGGGFLHDANGALQLAARDDAALSALAAAGGGRYVPPSADGSDIAALRDELRAGSTQAVQGQVGDEWQDRGPWLLLLLLPLAALAFRRGWLLLLPLVLLPMLPGTAHAASWRDLWQRRDQQAAAALGHGDAKQAMQLARDPAWRGAAAYRAGDYAAASQALREAKGGDAAYNLGNALARGGKYQDAIRAYDRALQIDPANADAKANRQAVEDWLRKQPPQDPSQQKPGQNGQDGKPQGDQGQNGQDKNGQGKDGQNQNGQNKNGQDQGGQDRNDSQSGQSPQDQSRHDPQQSSGKDGAQQDQPQPTPEQQAEQQAQAAKAQQALKQQLDQALGAPGKPATKPPTSHELGAAGADDPQSKLPADLRQALQRVPDDPGALLRRKFELEYQRRHGGTPDEDGP
ncbi:MAG: colicin transporter [Rhodanobacter sp. 68-29]|nr:tetratricopeptide repeat protein [Rhodanobacter sp.]ODU75359.1 MAG: colicin transporter [Rhodanobacter sp. SCN 69-32]OJY58583.1 MAG: colicin transporter [Rhodanobacter sp. 68-29]